VSAPGDPAAWGGLEVWRGGVNTWECDENGHMNVRFYVARAMEGVVGLAAALGLGGAFRERANATLLVRDHHIRFLREAHAGSPLHMVAGVIDIGECEARLLQLLVHSGTGELAASFQTVVVHATTGEERPFPWSAPTLRLAETLRMPVPPRAAPRSLDLTAISGTASLARADELGLIRLSAGAVGMIECDVFGRMRPEVFIGRVSDGIPILGAALRAGAPPRPGRVGGAVLEYRIAYAAWPQAGDRLVVRSGLAAVSEKTQRYVHWMLDPDTGRPWATAEAVAVALDLDARAIVPNSPEEAAFLSARITPGLAL
jgi:acyl-CoA thioester hydrolase